MSNAQGFQRIYNFTVITHPESLPDVQAAFSGTWGDAVAECKFWGVTIELRDTQGFKRGIVKPDGSSQMF
jgi:hypothetical protein